MTILFLVIALVVVFRRAEILKRELCSIKKELHFERLRNSEQKMEIIRLKRGKEDEE